MITFAVDRRSKANARRANAVVGQGECVGDVGDARVNACIRLVVLGGDVSRSESEYTSGHDERSVGFSQDRSNGLDDLSVRRGGLGNPREVVVVAEVDAPVAPFDAFAKARRVIERPPVNLGSGGCDRGCRLVGAREAHDVVAGREKFGNDRRADPARRSRHEYTHLVSPLIR